jgi:uncharacterized protein (TIGR02246 family)
MTRLPPVKLSPNAGREAEAIRAQRRLFNEAIAAHDAKRISICWLPDIQVSTSSGQPLLGRDEVQQAFARFFADPAFVTFERTPAQITISGDGRTAAEIGQWVGNWRGDPPTTLQGAYMASWQKHGGRWLIQAELYVPLEDA